MGHVPQLATAVLALLLTALASHMIWKNEKRVVQTRLIPPDTPPAEYLYLDSNRVLAYLGQVDGGLSASAKRVESEKQASSATVKGGLVAEINGSAEKQSSLEEIVTPAATDRFFSLLIKLRSGSEMRAGHRSPWLHEIDAAAATGTASAVRKSLEGVHEGDFVRIVNAHLSLPPYAALAPRARYAPGYSAGADARVARPRIPASVRGQSDLNAYLRRLSRDPVLPFVVTTGQVQSAPNGARFLVPARYSGLLDNARLLASNLTIVGKVIYTDARAVDDKSCQQPLAPSAAPCTYLDRQTVATFAPALERAPATVLQSLGVSRDAVAATVRRSVRFSAPVAVVLPVAIYQ